MRDSELFWNEKCLSNDGEKMEREAGDQELDTERREEGKKEVCRV